MNTTTATIVITATGDQTPTVSVTYDPPLGRTGPAMPLTHTLAHLIEQQLERDLKE